MIFKRLQIQITQEQKYPGGKKAYEEDSRFILNPKTVMCCITMFWSKTAACRLVVP